MTSENRAEREAGRRDGSGRSAARRVGVVLLVVAVLCGAVLGWRVWSGPSGPSVDPSDEWRALLGPVDVGADARWLAAAESIAEAWDASGESASVYAATDAWRALDGVEGARALFILDPAAAAAGTGVELGLSRKMAWRAVGRAETARAERLLRKGRSGEAVDVLGRLLSVTAALERGSVIAMDFLVVASLDRLVRDAVVAAAREGAIEPPAMRSLAKTFANRASIESVLGRVFEGEELIILDPAGALGPSVTLSPSNRPEVSLGGSAERGAHRRAWTVFRPYEELDARRLWELHRSGALSEGGPGPLTPLVRRNYEHFEELTPELVGLEVGRRALGLVVALEGYRLEHGEYPASLDALVPDWLGELPADPLAGDGSAFSYRRLDDPAEREEWGGPYVLWAEGDGVAGPSREDDVVIDPRR